MFSTVDDIHLRHRQTEISVAIDVTQVPEQGKLAGRGRGVCSCQGNAQNRVGAEVALILAAIQFNHPAVDRALVAAGAFALAYLPLVFVTVRAGHPIAELLWGGLLAAGATGALTALFAVPLELVERRGSKAPLP